jgi:hypothetical protein
VRFSEDQKLTTQAHRSNGNQTVKFGTKESSLAVGSAVKKHVFRDNLRFFGGIGRSRESAFRGKPLLDAMQESKQNKSLQSFYSNSLL